MKSNFEQSELNTQPTTDPDVPQTDVPQRKAWDRLEELGETPYDYSRFQKFLHLGPGRSILGLYRAEVAEEAAKAGKSPKKPDSAPSSLRKLAVRFNWWKRASHFTSAETAEDKIQYEATRRERRKQLLDQEWHHGQQMIELASSALSHGHKFFERTSSLVRGKVTETREYDEKTGMTVIVRERVDREIVKIALETGAINQFLMNGSKLSRMSVGMSSKEAQEKFVEEQAHPEMDNKAIDQQIYDMFEMLGANKPIPQSNKDEIDNIVSRDELSDGVDNQQG